MYTRTLGFQFDLTVWCKNEYDLKLNVADESTHDETSKKNN